MVFGTFGNVMTVVVMRGMRASQSTACLSLYFTALAVSDQCLLTSMLWYWVDTVFSWLPSFLQTNVLCTVTQFVGYTSTQTSAWFLVSMTYQRVTSVVLPHRVGVLCTVRRGKAIIAAVTTTACLLNLHFLFTFAYSREYSECVSREKYAHFIGIYTVIDLFVASVIPFLLLFIGNSVLVSQVVSSIHVSRKLRGSIDHQKTVYPMAVTLILTSTAFVILTLPVCIYDAYRRALDTEIVDQHFNAVLNLAEVVTYIMWFAASASNFYLYLLSGSKFRQETKRCLRL
ncbi:uncharacterized protein LOC143289693 [Babylonia areolata]|uniref:uncharacterized protein LOC143289693 n=1 Tax=Babylonia areolata TaxID=304850 RepID=UPI003FD08C1A